MLTVCSCWYGRMTHVSTGDVERKFHLDSLNSLHLIFFVFGIWDPFTDSQLANWIRYGDW